MMIDKVYPHKRQCLTFAEVIAYIVDSGVRDVSGAIARLKLSRKEEGFRFNYTETRNAIYLEKTIDARLIDVTHCHK